MIKQGCTHSHRIGDNYGTTCRDCGAQLRGYGYFGTFKTCIHLWLKAEDGNYAICMFCEREGDLETVMEQEDNNG